MAKQPVASFVERSNDDSQLEDLQLDLQVEMPGSMPVNETPEGIELEMEDDGGVIIDFDPQIKPEANDVDFFANLAENMEDGELTSIANDLLSQFDAAKMSRADWEDEYSKGLDMLGFKYEERTEPFRGATGVTHPLLAEAATQFQAQAFNEMLPAEGPVRTMVMGSVDPQKESQSKRVREFMNYYITNVMEEYTPEFDQMLFYLPLAGSTFKKVYFDESLNRAVSKFVPAENLVVPYDAADLDTSPFIAQVIRQPWNELRKLQVMGFYRDVPLHPTQQTETDALDAQNEIEGISSSNIDYDVTLLEFHVDMDLPGFEDTFDDGEPTGVMLPYIVTVAEETGEVLGIRRNYEDSDPDARKRQYFVHYKFLPGFGFYGLGLIHTIGGLSRTATAALRQLIDAGTLSNLPAGFKARGLRIRDDAEPLQPGEFRDVDSPGGAIRDSLMPLPFKGPDSTLFNLLGFVVQAGQRFATITDMKMGDGNPNAAVGTTIAMIEQGSRVMSAVHKRLHYAMRKELKLLARVMSESLPQEYPFTVEGGDESIMQSDFDDRVDVIPVSNPNIFSQSQRIALAQSQMEMAMQAPDLHDTHEAFRRMYEALGVRDIDKILKPKEESEPQPKDPASENIDSMDQVTLMAFEGQNHDAHIQAHLTFGASAMVQQVPPVAMALQKHVMQHVRLKAEDMARQQLQQMQLPPEQQEVQYAGLVSQFVAQFMQEVRQLSMQISGAGQEGPDPLVALKEQELQIKQQQVQGDMQVDQAKLNLEEQKLAERSREFDTRIQQTQDITNQKLQAVEERERMKLNAQLQQSQNRRQ